MERHSEHEKLQKLMRSYVPEFAYEPGGKDAPGSVLTDLCGDMMASCEERYEGVIDKHRIQYLNLFDGLIRGAGQRVQRLCAVPAGGGL